MRQKRTNQKKKVGGGGEGRGERKEEKRCKKNKQYALGKIRPWKRKSKHPVPNIQGMNGKTGVPVEKNPLVGCS